MTQRELQCAPVRKLAHSLTLVQHDDGRAVVAGHLPFQHPGLVEYTLQVTPSDRVGPDLQLTLVCIDAIKPCGPLWTEQWLARTLQMAVTSYRFKRAIEGHAALSTRPADEYLYYFPDAAPEITLLTSLWNSGKDQHAAGLECSKYIRVPDLLRYTGLMTILLETLRSRPESFVFDAQSATTRDREPIHLVHGAYERLETREAVRAVTLRARQLARALMTIFTRHGTLALARDAVEHMAGDREPVRVVDRLLEVGALCRMPDGKLVLSVVLRDRNPVLEIPNVTVHDAAIAHTDSILDHLTAPAVVPRLILCHNSAIINWVHLIGSGKYRNCVFEIPAMGQAVPHEVLRHLAAAHCVWFMWVNGMELGAVARMLALADKVTHIVLVGDTRAHSQGRKPWTPLLQLLADNQRVQRIVHRPDDEAECALVPSISAVLTNPSALLQSKVFTDPADLVAIIKHMYMYADAGCGRPTGVLVATDNCMPPFYEELVHDRVDRVIMRQPYTGGPADDRNCTNPWLRAGQALAGDTAEEAIAKNAKVGDRLLYPASLVTGILQRSSQLQTGFGLHRRCDNTALFASDSGPPSRVVHKVTAVPVRVAIAQPLRVYELSGVHMGSATQARDVYTALSWTRNVCVVFVPAGPAATVQLVADSLGRVIHGR